MLSRRKFMSGLLAAPAIVTPGVLMPVKSFITLAPDTLQRIITDEALGNAIADDARRILERWRYHHNDITQVWERTV